MVFTHRITHYTGTFPVRLVRSVIQFNHGPQDTSLYRLQAVPHIRKSTGHDDGHRIIDIRFFHRLFKIHFLNFVKYLIVHINSYPLKTVHLRHSVLSIVRTCHELIYTSCLSGFPISSSESLAVPRYGCVFFLDLKKPSSAICIVNFVTAPKRIKSIRLPVRAGFSNNSR